VGQTQWDVAVIGNIGIDSNVYFHGAAPDFSVESNFTRNRHYVGQAGGYAARGYAALGYRTAFVGHVGEDFLGREVEAVLDRDGIDRRALGRDPAATCHSVNCMFADGRRKNFYDGASHMQLPPPPEAEVVVAGARLAHFNLANWARRLLPVAKAAGALIACDLQDVADPHDPYRQDFIAAADILFFSAVNHDPRTLLQTFMARRPDALWVCGMGARGAALGHQGRIQTFAAVDGAEPVVDTNGAGDSLALGFLSGWLFEGLSVEAALLRGQINARHVCTLVADTDHLLSGAELARRCRQARHEDADE